MKVAKFSETRTTSGINVTPERHFFFGGVGHPRRSLNDGQPQVLNARTRRGQSLSGQMLGTVKVTPIKQSLGWFSLREVGPNGKRRTVYVHASALVVVDGEEAALGTWYGRHSS